MGAGPYTGIWRYTRRDAWDRYPPTVRHDTDIMSFSARRSGGSWASGARTFTADALQFLAAVDREPGAGGVSIQGVVPATFG